MQLLTTTPHSERFEATAPIENVSEAELAFIERLLAIIDIRNGVLSCISGWFSCWTQTRDFCLVFANSSRAIQEALAPRFSKLIEDLSDQGKYLVTMAVTDVLAIQDDHFKMATGASLADLGACISFLDDRSVEFFTKPSYPISSEVGNEPSAMVSASL